MNYQFTLDDIIIEYNPWTYMQMMFSPAPLMLTEDAHKTARIIAYNDRRQARIDGLYNAAENRNREADRRIEAGFKKLDVIPFGQPVHGVRDRNYRNKAGRQIDSGFRLSQEAERMTEKAEAAARNNAISSDDPLAIEKLTEKLDKAEKLQKKMVSANKAIRMKNTSAGDAKLAELGFSSEAIKKLREPDFCGRIGYPAYALQNNNQEIRRIKDRIKELQYKADQEPESWTGDGWTAETDLDDNRIRIYFDEKPDASKRAVLRSNGFKWSPKAGAWQRQITRSAIWTMNRIAESL